MLGAGTGSETGTDKKVSGTATGTGVSRRQRHFLSRRLRWRKSAEGRSERLALALRLTKALACPHTRT